MFELYLYREMCGACVCLVRASSRQPSYAFSYIICLHRWQWVKFYWTVGNQGLNLRSHLIFIIFRNAVVAAAHNLLMLLVFVGCEPLTIYFFEHRTHSFCNIFFKKKMDRMGTLAGQTGSMIVNVVPRTEPIINHFNHCYCRILRIFLK